MLLFFLARNVASMGPRLVSRGDLGLLVQPWRKRSFNGAAACEPRRLGNSE